MNKVVLAATLFLFMACDAKTDKPEEGAYTETKISATKTFACPMQCEGSKTYTKAGKCPVCKMDLKEIALAEMDSAAHNH